MPRVRKTETKTVEDIFNQNLEGFSSGYPMVDYISGVEGILFPRATIIELFGLKSSSKTTIVLETIAFQQMINPNFKVLYVDFEKMLRNEYVYLRQLGINVDSENFSCITPSFMEEGLEAIHAAVKANSVDMVVVDTVAAMRPQVEEEKGLFGNKQMGIKGKLMSEGLRNIMADMPKNGPAVIFVNQLYKDITSKSFIQLYDSPSSESLKFYAGVRIEVRASEKIKEKQINKFTLDEQEIPVGQITVIKTEKNKVGLPYLQSKYMVTYGMGVDVVPTIISAAIKTGAIQLNGRSKGSFIVPGKDKPIVGMSRLTRYLRDNTDALLEVGTNINEHWAKFMPALIERLERKRDAIIGATTLEYTRSDSEESDMISESLEEDLEDDLEDIDSAGSEEKEFATLDDLMEEAASTKVEKIVKPVGMKLNIK